MTQISTESRLASERPVAGLASLRGRLIVATAAITALAIAILCYYFYVRLTAGADCNYRDPSSKPDSIHAGSDRHPATANHGEANRRGRSRG